MASTKSWVKIAGAALAVSVCAAAAVFVVRNRGVGLMCTIPCDRWDEHGHRIALEYKSLWHRAGGCIYWRSSGECDAELSGVYGGDGRVRSYTTAEISSFDSRFIVDCDLNSFARAEVLYYQDEGTCATAAILLKSSAWIEATDGGGVEPVDPWGRPYLLSIEQGGHGFSAVCLGRDGIPGGAGEDADSRCTWTASMGTNAAAAVFDPPR
jgi:hypothetical protein